MASNTFGKLFAVTTFGESHGPAIGCVVDGCPPGLEIAPDDFVQDLARRATGKSRHTSQRREADEVEILSGVYGGRTTGTPIGLLIRNTDARSKDYDTIAAQFRPGHADYTYWHKYGIRDPRGGGRSSARETTMRVAAGVIARKWLAERHGVRIQGFVSQIGAQRLETTPERIDALGDAEGNPFFWPVAAQVPSLEAAMTSTRSGSPAASTVTAWTRLASRPTTPAASWAGSAAGRRCAVRLRSSRPPAFAFRSQGWTWTGRWSTSSPPGATTPAWASARYRSARRWLRWC